MFIVAKMAWTVKRFRYTDGSSSSSYLKHLENMNSFNVPRFASRAAWLACLLVFAQPSAHAASYLYKVVIPSLRVSSASLDSPPAPPSSQTSLSARLVASTQSLGFGAVEVGQASSAAVLFTNEGQQPFNFSGPPLVQGEGFSAVTSCAASLSAGQSCQVSVTFAPGSMGAASGTLSVSSSAGGIPVVVDLQGTGVQGVGDLAAAPGSSADFGSVSTGTSVTRNFVFHNSGNLSVSGVQVAVSSGKGLSVTSNTCGSVVAAGESCTFSVVYSPSVEGPLSSAEISVLSSAYNSPSKLSVTGSAIYVEPLYANVALLATGDEFPFVDAGPDHLSLAAGSTTKVLADTSIKKYGTASIGFTPSSSSDPSTYVIATSNRFAAGSQDFTLEGWIYLKNNSVGGFGTLASMLDPSDRRGVSFWVVGGNGAFRARVGRSVAGQFTDVMGSGSLAVNRWYHVAIVRAGTGANNLKLYVDGALNAQASDNTVLNSTSFVMGRPYPIEASDVMTGNLDDVRMTVGVARYTGAFTPPTRALTSQ